MTQISEETSPEITSSKPSDNACRFLLTNNDLPLVIAPGVEIEILDPPDGLLKIGLSITEIASSGDIRGAVPIMRMWQDRLIDWQGVTHTKFYAFPYVRRLYNSVLFNSPLADIVANRVNKDLKRIVMAYISFLKELEMVKDTFQSHQDYLIWLQNSPKKIPTEYVSDGFIPLDLASLSAEYAIAILADFNNDKANACETITFAIKEALLGFDLFGTDFPVTPNGVKSLTGRLETLRKKFPIEKLRDQESNKSMPIPDFFNDWGTSIKKYWGKEGFNSENIGNNRPFNYESFLNFVDFQ